MDNRMLDRSAGGVRVSFNLSTCLMLMLSATIGCSGPKITTQASNELPRYQVRTLALVPFSAMGTPQVHDVAGQRLPAPHGALASDIAVEVPSNVEQPLRQTTTVPPHAAEKITQLFWVHLRNQKNLTVLPPNQAAKAAATAKDADQATPELAAARLGRELHADAVLMGQVLVYQERVGSRMGADPPAAVGFEVKIVAADGQVLWVGNYYEKQKPVTQDFPGLFHHGWGFVTAEDLARYGVEATLKEFPFGSTVE